MKRWRRQDEWMGYAACGGDERFTLDELSDSDLLEVQEICRSCLTRPECILWSIRTKASAVVVAGTLLPDPAEKEQLKAIYERFEQILPNEYEARGDI